MILSSAPCLLGRVGDAHVSPVRTTARCAGLLAQERLLGVDMLPRLKTCAHPKTHTSYKRLLREISSFVLLLFAPSLSSLQRQTRASIFRTSAAPCRATLVRVARQIPRPRRIPDGFIARPHRCLCRRGSVRPAHAPTGHLVLAGLWRPRPETTAEDLQHETVRFVCIRMISLRLSRACLGEGSYFTVSSGHSSRRRRKSVSLRTCHEPKTVFFECFSYVCPEPVLAK